jgi:hypothetical protein
LFFALPRIYFLIATANFFFALLRTLTCCSRELLFRVTANFYHVAAAAIFFSYCCRELLFLVAAIFFLTAAMKFFFTLLPATAKRLLKFLERLACEIALKKKNRVFD